MVIERSNSVIIQRLSSTFVRFHYSCTDKVLNVCNSSPVIIAFEAVP